MKIAVMKIKRGGRRLSGHADRRRPVSIGRQSELLTLAISLLAIFCHASYEFSRTYGQAPRVELRQQSCADGHESRQHELSTTGVYLGLLSVPR